MTVTRRTLLAAGAAVGALSATGAQAGQPRYRWRNAEMVGGGFVPGIVFNPSEPGLVYARTDIGGAYRLDKRSQKWIPLLDWVGWDQWGWTGVASLATDPRDPDRLYLAVGTYTNDWDPNNGAILRSRDRGRTFKAAPLPFKLGGNMPGRGMGERLAVNPYRNSIVYFGAPSGQGLWRSRDFGASWSKVESFPNPGTFRPDPNDTSGYNSDLIGVVWVVFGARNVIYVGVADKDNPLYRSTDGGATWAPVPGTPKGFLPHKGVIGNGFLYLATSDTAGPYDGGNGEVWKLDLATDSWTNITPAAGAGWGYSGLTIDRQRPGTLMVATQISWWPDVVFFRSTDNGATWTRAWDIPAWPDRVNRYDIDISESPWLTWNETKALPEQSPKLGWMTESMEIDPFNSDRLLYGTGATIYGTDNLTAWDRGETVHIAVKARGLEETAILDLISPPTGAHLLSAVGDIGGFRHADFTAPGKMLDTPTFGSGKSLDYAGQAPEVIVRVGNPVGSWTRFGISRDSGVTWTAAATQPDGITGGGQVAVSADGAVSLWAPEGAAVHRSTDDGATWTAVAGLPAGSVIEADQVRANVFYGHAAGYFYVSTDSGASFTATASLVVDGDVRFKAVPGVAGDIWLSAGKTGMFRSTDGGATFARHAGLDEADNVGFGKPAPGRTYPAVFTSAKVAGKRGIFRSDDGGHRWVRINDDRHQWAWTGAAISGDPRVYGRVYIATNGRGLIVGDLS
ncbi:WD40/YVTN/BNR-like repeat-containing protein [Allorhizocola rhizosphaerae]|uniref:WD40/YVTN/BNR-like repeat-containing protein n=1 Tax=Allorhizocola rhizosphaerae TaxID=1872709 RepID=UPI000E3B990A|nr:sialidase family protein [Allorhizocola rhizosphaerae]